MGSGLEAGRAYALGTSGPASPFVLLRSLRFLFCCFFTRGPTTPWWTPHCLRGEEVRVEDAGAESCIWMGRWGGEVRWGRGTPVAFGLRRGTSFGDRCSNVR
ncbi:unnamed protein product [Ixodes pacificus]